MTLAQRWIAATAAAALLVLVAGWMLFVHPRHSQAADLRAQAVQNQEQTSKLKLTLQQLTAEAAQLPQYRSTLATLDSAIPGTPALPTLIRQLTTVARTSGVTLFAISPDPVEPYQAPGAKSSSSASGRSTAGSASAISGVTGLAQIPIELKIDGTYPAIEEFLSGLEQLPRAFIVSGYGLVPKKQGPSPGSAATTPGAPAGGAVTGSRAGGSTLELDLKGRVFTLPGETGAATPTGSAGTTTPTPSTGKAAQSGSTTAPTPSAPAPSAPAPKSSPITPSGKTTPPNPTRSGHAAHGDGSASTTAEGAPR